jgi:isopenicillin-N epimerase
MGMIVGRDFNDWDDVRNLFPLATDRIDMSAMLITSHPKPVADAIARYRAAMDERPVEFLEENDERLTQAVRAAAGEYLGVEPSHIALTDSTTVGIGLVYAGVPCNEGDEVITTKEDYVVTHESLRLAAVRTGAIVRTISLYEEAATASSDEIVWTIMKSITPATKLIALTWVHSSTGMKMPIQQIAAALKDVNAKRDQADQILLGLDAVHGFGIENVSFAALGCDFFMAGCHKWLFGPRGTGVIAVSDRGLAKLRPVMHSFDDSEVVSAWITGKEKPEGRNNGLRLTPGGFKPFEHRWAMTEAFALHARMGRDSVASRTHQLASMLKETLTGTSGITVATPLATELSSGIVSFKVKGDAPRLTASRLRERGIIASVAPYATPWVRLTPSVRNSDDEIEQVRSAIAEIV